MNDWLTTLQHGAAQLQIELSPSEEDALGRYLTLLLARNAQVNLTAITDPAVAAEKHLLDALTVERLWHPRPGDRALDLGTGAGLPGIPLAIRHPEVDMVLVDSVRKKVDFLQEVIDALPLPRATALWARVEELGRQPAHRGRYNAVFARAVAHLAVLTEYALPLLKVDGMLFAMKGPGGAAEIAPSAPALGQLGGRVAAQLALTLPGGDERLLIAVRKTRPTPADFPRAAGAIKKRPLLLDSHRT